MIFFTRVEVVSFCFAVLFGLLIAYKAGFKQGYITALDMATKFINDIGKKLMRR